MESSTFGNLIYTFFQHLLVKTASFRGEMRHFGVLKSHSAPVVVTFYSTTVPEIF